MFHFIGLTLFLLFFTGCTKSDKTHIFAELDGDVFSSYISDVDIANKEYLQECLKSSDFYTKYIETDTGTFPVYNGTSQIVDTNIYNFLIVIPIKSQQDLKTELNIGNPKADFVDFKLSAKNRYVNRLCTAYNDMNKTSDGYYHYNIYVYSHTLASEFYLNNVQNMRMSVNYTESSFDKELSITSNELNISAQQFENVLDSLGIPHERLSFQPEDF